MDDSNLLTHRELAEKLHISVATLYRMLKNGPPRNRGLDPRRIGGTYIGGKRYWFKDSADAELRSCGITGEANGGD